MSQAGDAHARQRVWRWSAASVTLGVALTAAALVADARLSPQAGFRQVLVDLTAPSGPPRVERLTPRVDLGLLDEDPALPRRQFRVRWEGVWHIPKARWIDLYAGADDRVTVTIDGRLVLERNPAVGMGTERARFPLEAGNHHLVIEYEQAGGGYSLNVLTGPAGGVPHRFSREMVFPSTPGPRSLAAVKRLVWLRRFVVLAWAAIALAVAFMLVGRQCLRATSQAALGWLERHRANWRRWHGGGAQPSARPPGPHVHRALAALYTLTVITGLGLFGAYYDSRNGFTSLIGFGGLYSDGVHPAVRAVPHYAYPQSPGYDGQFYAQLAVDPNPRSPDLARAVDSVPYRAKRMLFSWSAYALGLGRPAWVLQAYAVQNIVAWVLLAWLLGRWLPPSSLRHWAAWFACLFAFGTIFSVRFSLIEGPSLVLLVLAIAAAEHGRSLPAAAIIGVSGLGRETNLVAAAACLVPSQPGWRPRLRLLLMAALLAAPLLL